MQPTHLLCKKNKSLALQTDITKIQVLPGQHLGLLMMRMSSWYLQHQWIMKPKYHKFHIFKDQNFLKIKQLHGCWQWVHMTEAIATYSYNWQDILYISINVSQPQHWTPVILMMSSWNLLHRKSHQQGSTCICNEEYCIENYDKISMPEMHTGIRK